MNSRLSKGIGGEHYSGVEVFHRLCSEIKTIKTLNYFWILLYVSHLFIRNFISDKLVKMPPFAKQKPRTHDDSLNLVCAACWRKNKSVRTVSDSHADLLRKHVFEDYSTKNSFHPKVICDGCRSTITKLEKV